MLLHLPDGYKPEQVRDALDAKIKTLPDSLRLSLTKARRCATGNTSPSTPTSTSTSATHTRPGNAARTRTLSNGLLRQCFPKGTNLGVHSSDDLEWVAQELNDRPPKRLAFKKPIELIGDLLLR
jgi:transposase, IS30 family